MSAAGMYARSSSSWQYKVYLLLIPLWVFFFSGTRQVQVQGIIKRQRNVI